MQRSTKYSWLGGKKLQHFYKIEVTREIDTKYVYFHSTVHVDKVSKMPYSYNANHFSDVEILNDPSLFGSVYKLYGKVTVDE